MTNLLSEYKSKLGRVNRYNLQTLRYSPAAEISGALGDLGTLLPLMIALAIQGSIDLPTTLVFTGVFNVVTGVAFGIPLPVQPMKAIAAASIAQKSSLPETTAAGGWVGITVLFLSITGLIRCLTAHIPVPVVKGIQLGAGLQLIISAGSSLILPLRWFSPLLDNRTWAIIAFLALLLVIVTPPKAKTPPYALLVFIAGMCFSLISILLLEPGSDESNSSLLPPPALPSFSIWHPSIRIPAFLSPSSISMALSQLPLTTLNSIIAVCALAEDLFPPPRPQASESLPLPITTSPNTGPISEEPSPSPSPIPPSTTALGISISIMNLLACFTGCMPVCHGSGGLAGQYKFRSKKRGERGYFGFWENNFGIVSGEFLD